MRIASPGLYEEAERWQQGVLSTRDSTRVERALLKYALRASHRATPFGLFATWSVGRFGETTGAALAPPSHIRIGKRLDMDAAVRLADALTSAPSVRAQIRFFPNSTIYRVAGDIRYYEHWRDELQQRHYRLVAIEGNPYLLHLIEAARAGATLDALAAVVADERVSVEEARQYASDLVDNQVLVSELEPSLTDPAFIDTMAAAAGGEALDRALGEVRPSYQVDAFRPAAATLGREIKGSIEAALTFLVRLAPPTRHDRLTEFHLRFRERFGDRSVPLLRALDADLGIPYGRPATAMAPLLDGLEDVGEPGSPAPGSIDAGLLQRICDAVEADAPALELTEADLPVSPRASTLPASFSAVCSIVTVDGKPRVLLRAAGGASAVALIGRATHLDDEILDQARTVAAHEARVYGDAIVADLLHLPDDRHGNILLHARVRDFEIPCLARSSADAAHQLPLDDLVLTAPAGGALQLRSAAHDRDVIPLLGNAHRYTAPELLPAYRLLADLQARGIGCSLVPPIGTLMQDLPRLPRLTFRDCIVAPAAWRFRKEEFDAIPSRLPAHVYLRSEDGESDLFLDLASAAGRDLMTAELRGRSTCVFTEDLFAEPGQWLRGPDGQYANEVIVAVLVEA